jgi:signal transduction histidine kinase
MAGCLAAGLFSGFLPIAVSVDHYTYDLMLTKLQPAGSWEPQSVVVAIDERTLGARGGRRNLRTILAGALDRIATAKPLAVVSDVTLHDSEDAEEDARLAASLHATRNLVLPCQVVADKGEDKWEDPLPVFKKAAVALGHVHLETDRADGVSRQIPLEIIADGKQRWALALAAFSVARGKPIIQSPDDLEIGGTLIPAARREDNRPMLIRYLPAGIPRVSVLDLDRSLEMLRGKTVFLGVTALSMANDRLLDPYRGNIAGVEEHAQAFETIARGRFLIPAGNLTVLALCALFAAAAGVTFALRSGWQAHGLGLLIVALAMWTPIEFFRHDIVFPFFAPFAVACLSTVGAASFQHFFVRGELRRSESEKSRYQQAIHWVAHEMRSPLTAIQGSSEIMTRYTLPEQKRQQLSETINAESKRMARMIQTFLDVERLADGQMEMKREVFPAAGVIETCLKRVEPLAERKKISMFLDTAVDARLKGDRELMEYAFYNLLTNAVKYSPVETEVHVSAEMRGGELRVSVRDQGIGMDAKELKSIFKKFYRTKRAEASGEAGTGIGLAIVEQIVTHHGGRMEVASEPGKGSCFTMIIAASHNAETVDRGG